MKTFQLTLYYYTDLDNIGQTNVRTNYPELFSSNRLHDTLFYETGIKCNATNINIQNMKEVPNPKGDE